MAANTEQWKADTIKHVKILARLKGGKVSVSDYLAYRRSCTTVNLPSGTTLYRLFGSFPDLLDAAGINAGEKATTNRMREEDMIADLQYVAKKLDLEMLSTHAYDRFRKPNPAPDAPVSARPVLDKAGKKKGESPLSSSSVIRKHLGRWGIAVSKAGLKSSERTTAPKPTEVESIDALRQAKARSEGRLTPTAYNEFRDSLPDDERTRFPTAMEILDHFPTWVAALKVADVEQSDAIHPHALYTAEEVRRIVRQCEQVLRKTMDQPDYQLEQEGYEMIQARAQRPMPAWDVVLTLMAA